MFIIFVAFIPSKNCTEVYSFFHNLCAALADCFLFNCYILIKLMKRLSFSYEDIAQTVAYIYDQKRNIF